MVDIGSSRFVTVGCADHSQYVALALRNLFDSKRGTDFDFRWGQKSARAHKIILELFLAPEVIDSTADQAHEPPEVKLEVPDDASEGINYLYFFLEFLYKGEVTVPEGDLGGLLKVAEELDFQMLVDAVVHSGYSKVTEVESVLSSHVEDAEVASENVGNLKGGTRKRKSGKPSTGHPNRRAADHEVVHEPQVVKDVDSPLNFFSDTFVESHIVHYLEGEGREDFDPGPGCSSSNQLGLEANGSCWNPGDDSETALSGAERGIFGSGDVMEYSEDEEDDDDGGASCDDLFYSGAVEDPGNMEVRARKNKCIASKMCKCPHCEFETPRYKTYYDHLSTCHGVNSRGEPAQIHKCPHCDFEAPKYNKYRYHLMLVHGLTTKGQLAPRHKCSDCDYSSVLMNRLKSHRQTWHSAEKPHACQHCNYVGKEKNTLVKHLYVVHGVGETRFPCELCGQRCASRAGLERHSRIHTQEKPLKCPHCGKVFKGEFNLRGHVLTSH